jgi:uncharacterized protein (DUF4415 family)
LSLHKSVTTWDETKRRRNLAKHGVDLAIAERFDFHTAWIREDDSEAYGEQREIAIGWIGDALYTYVYTLRRDETTRSACEKPHRRNDDAMSKRSEVLTAKELKEIARLRAQARERARRLIDATTDEEDAALVAAAESDPDNPPLTDDQLRRMRPAHEVSPQLVARQLRRERGRPKSDTTKEQITLRIDRDVLEKFRSTGEGWQSRINAVLRKAAKV